MLGFAALSEVALSELPGAASFDIDIHAAVSVAATANAANGLAVGVVAVVPIAAALALDFTDPAVTLDAQAVVPVTAAVGAAHGAATGAVAVVPVSAVASAVHGVAVNAAVVLPVAAAASEVHGVALGTVATVGLAASMAGLVERYELRGEVRLAGVLVNRRVRAYRRDTGALVSEADTTAGRFALPAGFVGGVEFTVVPIDLAAEATDWSPPVANRVVPVLALDTA